MWPALKAVKALGGSATNDEMLDKVIEVEQIPDSVQNVMHTETRTELNFNLAWAVTYLHRYGALEHPSRGLWAVTGRGRALTEGELGPGEVQKLYKDAPPEEAKPLDEGAGTWKDKLLDVLTGLTPDAFERLARRVLQGEGYEAVTVTGGRGDGGIDGVGVLRSHLLSSRVCFQCKRYTGNVPPNEIREFQGAVAGRADKGLFITTGTFGASAKREATRDGATPIDLVDGYQLCDELKRLNLGVVTDKAEQVVVIPEVFAAI
jgi:restriction system protein